MYTTSHRDIDVETARKWVVEYLCVDAEEAQEMFKYKKLILPLKWLRDNYMMKSLESNDVAYIDCCVMAYLLHLFVTVLFADKMGTSVPVYYLQVLMDLKKKYAWGPSILSHTYRELSKTSRKGATGLSCYFTLISTWGYEHFILMGTTYIKPSDEYNDEAMPRICRWDTIGRGGHLDSDKMRYRNYFDNLKADDFTFQPWGRRTRPCPEIAFFQGCLAFIDNAMPYHPDRVLRKLGHTQRWPKKMTIPWISDKNYKAKSEKFTVHYPCDQDEWGAWEDHVLTAEEHDPKSGSKDSCSIEYTSQYKKFSHLIINPRLRSDENLGAAKPEMGEEPKVDPNVVNSMGSLRQMDKFQMGEDARSLLHKAIGYLKRALACGAPSALKESDPNPRPQKKKKDADPSSVRV